MMKTCFQKSASAIAFGALLILSLTLITVLAQSKYAKRADDAATHAAAAKVLKKIDRTPDRSHADAKAVPAEATLPGEAVAAAEPAAFAVVKVSMRNMQFYPQSLKVKKGTVVEWKNDDLVPHTATSSSFDSGSLGPGKSWRYTVTKAGQFPYACTFHPTMRGVVIVK
jgi:plastocyanin